MTKIVELTKGMISYEKGEPKRVQHFLKVYAYAKLIGESEHVEELIREIVEAAALVHDIGIQPALQKYGSSNGIYQQKEGPVVAERMLRRFGFDEELIRRVSFLVGHHHTYTGIDGIDYQILVEADFLVNIDEGEMNLPQILSVKENVFRTRTGIEILNDLFLSEKMLDK